MQGGDNVDIENTTQICFKCVGESYLSNEIRRNGRIATCSYCGITSEAYPIDEFAERIETAFDAHYFQTLDRPESWQETILSDRESAYEWERSGTPVTEAIEAAADIPEDAAIDVQIILEEKHNNFEADQMGEETKFSSESYYDERGSNDKSWQEEWRAFERSLKREARFFNRIAASHLSLIFGGIDKLNTTDSNPIVLDAGPKFTINHLYRARVFQSNVKLEEALCRPDHHLGSPPEIFARAGRMNPTGISVFYGALDTGVAIAEVRPPVGSKIAVAKFNITRPLRLLDLTALNKVQDEGSIFDPSLKGRLERIAFLRSLEQRMTRPVMPDDEIFDYLATQAISDFLATENEPCFDGVVYRSSQVKDGRNVVLFHKAAQCKILDFPEGTKISVNVGYGTEEGWEEDYSVTEIVRLDQQKSILSDDEADFLDVTLDSLPSSFRDDDTREPALRIDPESVVVHHVEWVDVKTVPFKVDRLRYDI